MSGVECPRAQSKNHRLRFPEHSLCAELHGDFSTQQLHNRGQQVTHKLQLKNRGSERPSNSWERGRRVQTQLWLHTCTLCVGHQHCHVLARSTQGHWRSRS